MAPRGFATLVAVIGLAAVLIMAEGSTASARSTTSDGLWGVACPSTSLCIAVGQQTSGAPLAEEWQPPAAWTTMANPLGIPAGTLQSVSCASATDCIAVGETEDTGSGTQNISEQWNGSGWSILSTPNPTTDSQLHGISCANVKHCMAVGWSSGGPGDPSSPEIEQWNGSNWRLLSSPTLSGSLNQLNNVSCDTATFCVAVGITQLQSLAEVWNGSTWIVAPAANPGASENSLIDVSCVKSVNCQAVGFSLGPTGELTLAEKWTGSAFVAEQSANPKGKSASLDGVVCKSGTVCNAVGFASPAAFALTERLSSGRWVKVTSPKQVGSSQTSLFMLSCPSKTLCVAVGNEIEGSNEVTFAQVMNGKTWTAQLPANP